MQSSLLDYLKLQKCRNYDVVCTFYNSWTSGGIVLGNISGRSFPYIQIELSGYKHSDICPGRTICGSSCTFCSKSMDAFLRRSPPCSCGCFRKEKSLVKAVLGTFARLLLLFSSFHVIIAELRQRLRGVGK
jgi:hypothetical protein